MKESTKMANLDGFLKNSKKVKVVQMSLDEMMLRMEIAEGIKAISLGEENAQLNAYGMQMLAIKVALGQK
jgi:hypothetical protein